MKILSLWKLKVWVSQYKVSNLAIYIILKLVKKYIKFDLIYDSWTQYFSKLYNIIIQVNFLRKDSVTNIVKNQFPLRLH